VRLGCLRPRTNSVSEPRVLVPARLLLVPDCSTSSGIRALITLLSWGADSNNMDEKLNTPLTLAANQNHAVCVRLLLEAGALPDPQLPPGVKFGTPLNCAARNARDPVLSKTLLDFNADIEASGVDGVRCCMSQEATAPHTPCFFSNTARTSTRLRKADRRRSRRPSSTTTLLKLLLERWFEYNECPRLTGPNLLEIVARYADVETMLLLTAEEHLRATL
jgi:hypothetical protein